MVHSSPNAGGATRANPRPDPLTPHPNADVPDVRGSMQAAGERLPARLQTILQHFLTWLTGKPLPEQVPLWRRNEASHVTTTLAALFAGAWASDALLRAPSSLCLFFLPASWTLTVFGARKLQAVICHHAAHGRLFANAWLNRSAMNVLSLLSISQPYSEYRRAHDVHHSSRLATLEDPDLQFLFALGFRPGLSRVRLWRHLLRTMSSPRFHWVYLKARLAANFLEASAGRRLIAWAAAALTLCIVASTNSWVAFAVSWVFPLTVLYHVSGLLQFVTEHRWCRVGDITETAAIQIYMRTAARFCGEAVPAAGGCWAWARWWWRMLGPHLATRLWVVQGDLEQHDYHHRKARGDWANAAYARREDLQRHPSGYTETWGLFSAIDSVFQVMSTLPDAASVARPDRAIFHTM